MVMEKVDVATTLLREKVKDSLRRMTTLLGGDRTVSARPQTGPAPKPEARRTVAPLVGKPLQGWTRLDQLSIAPNQPPPAQIRFPDGSACEVRYWKHVLSEVARFLVEKGAFSPQDCPIKLRPSSKRFLLHTDARHPNGKSFFMPVQIGQMWVETHADARLLQQQALLLIERAGFNPSAFAVFYTSAA